MKNQSFKNADEAKQEISRIFHEREEKSYARAWDIAEGWGLKDWYFGTTQSVFGVNVLGLNQ